MAKQKTAKPSTSKKPLGRRIKAAPGKALASLLAGDSVSVDFFLKHKIAIFLTLLLFIFFIASKYQCGTKRGEIDDLKQKVQIVRTESVREASRYHSRIRESAMTALADSIRPGLTVQTQPPYELTLN